MLCSVDYNSWTVYSDSVNCQKPELCTRSPPKLGFRTATLLLNYANNYDPLHRNVLTKWMDNPGDVNREY